MVDLREPGFTVRLRLRDDSEADDSFMYWSDQLPYAGQLIEVTSEYFRGSIQALVTRLTPDDAREIHASEVAG